MFITKSFEPSEDLTVECSELFDILTKYKMNKLVEALEQNKCIGGLPAASFLYHKRDSILKSITDEKDAEFVKDFDVIDNFITATNKIIRGPIHIPEFNMYHFGAICHLNACMSLLSSLTLLVREMNNIVRTNNSPASSADFDKFKLITQYINNSYSRIDLNLGVIHSLLIALNINPYSTEESTETMKSIMKILYANVIHMSTVFFWDSSDEFYDEPNTTLGNKINTISPIYLIVNAHDMNTLFDYETDKVKIKAFNVQESKRYTLSSLIAYYANHLVSMFSVNDDKFKIINDLNTRYTEEYIDSDTLFDDDSSHVLACYLSDNR